MQLASVPKLLTCSAGDGSSSVGPIDVPWKQLQEHASIFTQRPRSPIWRKRVLLQSSVGKMMLRLCHALSYS